MRSVFVDSSYWIARFNTNDQWAQTARLARSQLGGLRPVTTEEVLTEFLNDVSNAQPRVRAKAGQYVRNLFLDPDVDVIRQSHESFDDGLELYGARPDKGYSLTDCISMNAMRERGIRSALTADRRFAQEGFTVLIKPAS